MSVIDIKSAAYKLSLESKVPKAERTEAMLRISRAKVIVSMSTPLKI